jgi:hypothetical protein
LQIFVNKAPSCVNPEGNLYLSVNKGGANGRTPPRFEKTPNGGLILNGKGEQRRVRLADIDVRVSVRTT